MSKAISPSLTTNGRPAYLTLDHNRNPPPNVDTKPEVFSVSFGKAYCDIPSVDVTSITANQFSTGFIISETIVDPDPANPRWSATAPTNYEYQ